MALALLLAHISAQPVWLLLSSLGFLSLAKLSLAILRWVYAFFLRPAKDLRLRYGSWAVVTGATDGIGKAIAFELARRGLNLVLVGRNPDKLKLVSEAINEEVATAQIKNVVFDLSGDVRDGISWLREVVRGLDVGLLVNNAGVAIPGANFFHEVDVELWMKMVRVNLEALTEITHAVLPGMVQRRRGAVVNVGSGSTVVIPSYPLFAVYAGTKGYVAQFSRSLYVEYKNRGIDVQCQFPLYVATKMIKGMGLKHSLFVPSPDAYAKAAVRWIGYEPLCTPYWPHFVQWCIASLLPDFIHDEMRMRHHVSRSKRRTTQKAVK